VQDGVLADEEEEHEEAEDREAPRAKGVGEAHSSRMNAGRVENLNSVVAGTGFFENVFFIKNLGLGLCY